MKFLAFPYRLLHWLLEARPIRFTRFGTFYILFSIGVGAAAINTGNNLLYIILGILLGFIVISGFLSDSGLWGLRTEWHPLGSLYAGQKAIFECRAQKGWFPGVAVTLDAYWTGATRGTAFAPWIPARGSTSLRFSVTPAKRGYLELERCVYATRFPFGLFQKLHTWFLNERWVVYPAVRRLPQNLIDPFGHEAARESAEKVGRGSVPFILRDYRTGDALRHVHWKASAKRQRLIVKDMEDELSRGDLYVLSAWPTDLDAESFERFISFVASLIFSAFEEGRAVGLATPDRFFSPEASRPQMHRILEYLALVEPTGQHSANAARAVMGWRGRVTDVLALWRMQGSRYDR